MLHKDVLLKIIRNYHSNINDLICLDSAVAVTPLGKMLNYGLYSNDLDKNTYAFCIVILNNMLAVARELDKELIQSN